MQQLACAAVAGDYLSRLWEHIALVGRPVNAEIANLLLWLIETGVFQLPQLHKHYNVSGKLSRQSDPFQSCESH